MHALRASLVYLLLTSSSFASISVVRDHFYNKRLDKAESIIYSSKLNLENPEMLYYLGKIKILKLRSAQSMKEAEVYLSTLNLNGAQMKLNEAASWYPENRLIPEQRSRLKRLRETDIHKYLSIENRIAYEDLIKKGRKQEEGSNLQGALENYRKAVAIFAGEPAVVKKIKVIEETLAAEEKRRQIAQYTSELNNHIKKKDYASAIGTLQSLMIIEPEKKEHRIQRDKLRKLLEEERLKKEKMRIAREHLVAGKALLSQKKFQESLEQYQFGLAVLPEFADWDGLMQETRLKHKQHKEYLFEQVINQIESLFQEGISFDARDKFQQAIETFGRVIELSKKYNQTEIQKQARELQRRSLERYNARQATQVGEQSPYYELVQSLLSLGEQAYKQKSYERAKFYYGSILEIFPKNSEANLYFLSASIQLRPETKAQTISKLQDEVEKSMAEKYEADRVLDLLEALDKRNRRTKSLRVKFQQFHKLNIKKVDRRKMKALFTQGQELAAESPEEAVQVLKKLIQQDPTYPGASSLLARIEGRLSRSSWDQPLKATNQKAQNLYAEGMLYYNAGQIQKAYTAFQRAVQIDPTFQRARFAFEKCKSYLNQS